MFRDPFLVNKPPTHYVFFETRISSVPSDLLNFKFPQWFSIVTETEVESTIWDNFPIQITTIKWGHSITYLPLYVTTIHTPLHFSRFL